jgi:hypothetical protein
MSAFLPKADMAQRGRDVRFVPKAHSVSSSILRLLTGEDNGLGLVPIAIAPLIISADPRCFRLILDD